MRTPQTPQLGREPGLGSNEGAHLPLPLMRLGATGGARVGGALHAG